MLSKLPSCQSDSFHLVQEAHPIVGVEGRDDMGARPCNQVRGGGTVCSKHFKKNNDGTKYIELLAVANN